MQKKKGISLIVLVITIIVMIILAATIIISINNANVMNKANEAVSKSDFATIKNAASLEYANIILGEDTGGKWQGEYVKDKLIEQGILTEDSAKQYRFYNNGEVVKLLTEQEYNEMYKTQLQNFNNLNTEYYTITADGTFTLTSQGKSNFPDDVEIALPYGVTKIDRLTFTRVKIKKLIMPDTVTEIDTDAFYLCNDIEDMILSKNIKKLGKNTWYNFTWIKNKLKSETLAIEEGILLAGNISDKTSLKIPNTVEIIASDTFFGNYMDLEDNKLLEVTMANTVMEVGDYAFLCQGRLSKINFEGKIPKFGYASLGATALSESLKNEILAKNNGDTDIFENGD